jgi:hypothetical protein
MTRAEANKLLDFARAGGEVSTQRIIYALWLTGDIGSNHE